MVSGLLTAHDDSPVARILDGMLGAQFPFVVSELLLAEYRAVLLRPRLCKLHRLSTADVDVILTDCARHAIVMAPSSTMPVPLAPDPGDQFLWNLLATHADLLLVTGDQLLQSDKTMQQRIISPQAFVARLQH